MIAVSGNCQARLSISSSGLLGAPKKVQDDALRPQALDALHQFIGLQTLVDEQVGLIAAERGLDQLPQSIAGGDRQHRKRVL